MFAIATGDLIGLPTSERHINLEWIGEGKVMFSLTRRGDGLSCHFAADKSGLRWIKQAINEFCARAFSWFKWCKMIIAVIDKPSVERVVRKCGFKEAMSIDGKKVYLRVR